jgi:hypothetical protein
VKSLLRLWGWCAASRPTGEVGDAEDLEIAARWFGKAGDLAECLLTLGLIEKTEGGFAIHQWAEHNPWVAEREARSEAARVGARVKWERQRAQSGSKSGTDAVAMQPQCNRNATAEHDDMLPTQPNPTQPCVGQNDVSPPAVAAPTTDTPKKKRPPMLADDAEWLATIKAEPAYRGIDVDRELSKCRAYFSTKGVTVSRQRFLNWLNRADRQLAGGNAPPRGPIRVEMREGRLVSVCNGQVIQD